MPHWKETIVPHKISRHAHQPTPAERAAKKKAQVELKARQKARLSYLSKDPEELRRIYVAEADPDTTDLSVAENVLQFKALEDNIAALDRPGPDDLMYQPSSGESTYNDAIVDLLNTTLHYSPPLEKSSSADISTGSATSFSGTRCALEVLFQVLFDKIEENPDNRDYPGRAIMIPTPYWQGFDWICSERVGADIVPIHLTSPDFELTLGKIDEAYKNAEITPSMILLTNPHNPLGVNYGRAFMDMLLDWCICNHVYLLCDEIYAHCQVDLTKLVTDDNLANAVPFDSVLSVNQASTEKGIEHCHAVWGLAKDFGLSGFRVGQILSRSEDVHTRARSTKYVYFSPMTSSNNWITSPMLYNTAPTSSYSLMAQLPYLLTAAYKTVKKSLQDNNIIFFSGGAYAAQFFWIDLSDYLRAEFPPIQKKMKGYYLLNLPETLTQEQKLDKYLVIYAQVSLLPGHEMHASEEGWFRLCYTADSTDVVTAAIGRMADALAQLTFPDGIQK